MGVVFKKQPDDAAVRHQINEALAIPPPSTDEERNARADELMTAAKAEATVTVDWKKFLIAFGIFAALLAVAIVVDWANIVDDPTIYSGFAGTALGAVLGFLTGDAAATATS
jgi:hypothetical protein